MHGTPAQRNTATLETPQRTTGVSVRALTEGARPAHAVGRGDAASRGAATAAGRAGLLLQERAEREDQTQRKLDAALEAAIVMYFAKNRAESRKNLRFSQKPQKKHAKTAKKSRKIAKNRAKNLAFSRNLVLGRRVFVWPRAFTPGLSVMGGFLEDNTCAQMVTRPKNASHVFF